MYPPALWHEIGEGGGGEDLVEGGDGGEEEDGGGEGGESGVLLRRLLKSLETVNIFLRLSTSISVNFDVVTAGLKGGRDDIPTSIVTEIMPSSNNLFFFPIPADFLFVQSKNNFFNFISLF